MPVPVTPPEAGTPAATAVGTVAAVLDDVVVPVAVTGAVVVEVVVADEGRLPWSITFVRNNIL